MQSYHDEEWGVPEYDSRALWEKLMLDGFQAGLSWITILRKREAFREAFQQFNPEAVARFGETDIERLLGNAGIIRSRAKIEATITGARVWLEMQSAGEDFSRFVLEHRGRKAYSEQGSRTREHPVIRANIQSAQAAGLQIRRARYRVRVDAGDRDRQRSRRRLLSEESGQ